MLNKHVALRSDKNYNTVAILEQLGEIPGVESITSNYYACFDGTGITSERNNGYELFSF